MKKQKIKEFTCEKCETNLKGGIMWVHKGMFYCAKCYRNGGFHEQKIKIKGGSDEDR